MINSQSNIHHIIKKGGEINKSFAAILDIKARRDKSSLGGDTSRRSVFSGGEENNTAAFLKDIAEISGEEGGVG